MHAIMPMPAMSSSAMTSSFVIGIESGLGSLASSLGRAVTLPRFDRLLALDPSSAAARSRFAYRLDAAVREADRAVLLVGSGIACPAIAWWARLSPRQYTSRVAGALFFAPEAGRSEVHGAFASPRERLGFPSIVLGDPASEPDAALAAGWGSEVIAYGTDDESLPAGAKPWHWVQRTVRHWTAAIVEHDVRLAASLAGQTNHEA